MLDGDISMEQKLFRTFYENLSLSPVAQIMQSKSSTGAKENLAFVSYSRCHFDEVECLTVIFRRFSPFSTQIFHSSPNARISFSWLWSFLRFAKVSCSFRSFICWFVCVRVLFEFLFRKCANSCNFLLLLSSSLDFDFVL